VPATSLTNWPDEFIHSTGDDLENIDATQLERNAVVVAAVALYFANVDEADTPALAAYVAARARARTANDVATATVHMATAAADARDEAYRAAQRLVRESHRKEAAALASVRRLARGRGADLAGVLAARLDDTLGADLETVDKAWIGLTGRTPPKPAPTAEERAMGAKVFVPATDVGVWLDALEKVRGDGAGLHGMMRFEAYNFADGRRSAWEVYEAVAAEALSAGEWYYGSVAPADVLETLERAAKAGAYTLKSGK